MHCDTILHPLSFGSHFSIPHDKSKRHPVVCPSRPGPQGEILTSLRIHTAFFFFVTRLANAMQSYSLPVSRAGKKNALLIQEL